MKISRTITRLAVGVLLLFLLNCGKKGKSSEVDIVVLPEQPIVFTSDLTYLNGTSTVTVPKNWFKFSLGLNNHSDSAITISALHVEVTMTSSTGSVTRKTADFNPNSFNYTVSSTSGGVTTSTTCTFSDFGQFDPRGIPAGPSYNNRSLFLIATPVNAACGIVTPTFYVGGLTDASGGNNFTYRVKVTPVGWFGDRNHPEDRFSGSTTFSTQ